MQNNDFYHFWETHKNDYLEHAKQLAMADFKSINTKKQGDFICKFTINSDDDFSFTDDEFSFTVYANTQEETIQRTIDFLMHLKLTQHSECNNEKWTHLRDLTVKELNQGYLNINLGGNQTINLTISENKPTIHLKKKI